jgi:hypothetical protein
LELHAELLEPLLVGLSDSDKTDIMRRINRAGAEQLERKVHPPRRRRRGPDGTLRWPEEMAPVNTGADLP